MTTFFQALVPGQRLELGEHLFTAEAIVAFASRYDPQRFHVDAQAARDSVFGALCASGWHTASVWMRLNVLHGRDEMRRVAAWDGPLPVFGPSPGIRDLKWLRPVFAGETVRYWSEIEGTRPSNSRPGWGIVSTASGGELPDGTPVLSMRGAVLVPTT